jgi:hypothetical protein
MYITPNFENGRRRDPWSENISGRNNLQSHERFAHQLFDLVKITQKEGNRLHKKTWFLLMDAQIFCPAKTAMGYVPALSASCIY